MAYDSDITSELNDGVRIKSYSLKESETHESGDIQERTSGMIEVVDRTQKTDDVGPPLIPHETWTRIWGWKITHLLQNSSSAPLCL